MNKGGTLDSTQRSLLILMSIEAWFMSLAPPFPPRRSSRWRLPRMESSTRPQHLKHPSWGHWLIWYISLRTCHYTSAPSRYPCTAKAHKQKLEFRYIKRTKFNQIKTFLFIWDKITRKRYKIKRKPNGLASFTCIRPNCTFGPLTLQTHTINHSSLTHWVSPLTF